MKRILLILTISLLFIGGCTVSSPVSTMTPSAAFLPTQTAQPIITEMADPNQFAFSVEVDQSYSQEEIAEILYTKWLDHFRSDEIRPEIRLSAYTINDIEIPIDQKCAVKLGGSFVAEAQVTFQTFLPQASTKDEKRSEFFTAGGGNIIDAYTQSRSFNGVISQLDDNFTLKVITQIPMCE